MLRNLLDLIRHLPTLKRYNHLLHLRTFPPLHSQTLTIIQLRCLFPQGTFLHIHLLFLLLFSVFTSIFIYFYSYGTKIFHLLQAKLNYHYHPTAIQFYFLKYCRVGSFHLILPKFLEFSINQNTWIKFVHLRYHTYTHKNLSL